LIDEIDEFKGARRALGTLVSLRLRALRGAATIESSKLSDREVDRLLANLGITSFCRTGLEKIP